jgi:2-dehydropantoate 2-reductase
VTIRNIGVVGVGGVGGYFGGKLCQVPQGSDGLNVSFVARGEHLRVIQARGLLLSSEEDDELVCKPALATDDFRRLPRLDLCLICVKEFDLAAALSRLEPAIGDNTIVLSLLNGVDVYSRVRNALKKGIVLPACVFVGTHIERPGKVVQKGGACKILFGPDPLRPGYVPEETVQLFNRAKIKSEWTANIQAEIWKKFIFICAFGLVSAANGKTLGEILANDKLRSDAQAIMMEAISLAEGTGVRLPERIAEESLLKARSFPYEAKTSFQRDYERVDRNDERDLFAGSMIRIAGELGIAVPVTREVSSLLEKRKPRRSEA